MKKIIPILLLAIFAMSCTKDNLQEPNISVDSNETDQPIAINSGILSFESADDLLNTVNALKEADSFEIIPSATTRSVGSNFISLRQHLTEQGLREFTDAELAEISKEELIYEPEDEIIVDPYFTAVLNKDREVQVGDKIIRYIDEGMVVYDASLIGSLDTTKLNEKREDLSDLMHGQKITLDSNIGNMEFTRIERQPQLFVFEDDMGMMVSPNPSGGYSTILINESTPYNNDGSLTLSTGVKIPREKIKRTIYKKGNGDSNWIQSTLSGIWGTNVTLENYYDKRHRMKLRMYDQDYILYRAIGMTVRMQERTLRIWWRKKAQEFRYGWTAIECEYKFPKPAFLDPPKMPNDVHYNKYPLAMIKNFPFEKKDIVLFNIPFANYNVKTGDINKVYSQGMSFLVGQIKSWYNSAKGKGYKDNPRGLYTTRDNDRKILVVYPKGEDFAYKHGREVVRWDLSWFSGTFIASFSKTIGGAGWSVKDVVFNASTRVEIIRGRVYGAVKYNNEWRACIIETE